MIAITNRHLCPNDFLHQIDKIAASRPSMIILREKDLPEKDYLTLARDCLQICQFHQVPFVIHTYVNAARTLSISNIHLPLPVLKETADLSGFDKVGASVHSLEEARLACAMGATYLIAGHIFDTNCKSGLPGRGPEFLREICHHVTVPVYGIGGITPENLTELFNAGASDGCMMSSYMRM